MVDAVALITATVSSMRPIARGLRARLRAGPRPANQSLRSLCSSARPALSPRWRHREAAPGAARPRGLDGGVECQQVGLRRDLADHLRHVPMRVLAWSSCAASARVASTCSFACRPRRFDWAAWVAISATEAEKFSQGRGNTGHALHRNAELIDRSVEALAGRGGLIADTRGTSLPWCRQAPRSDPWRAELPQ